MSIDQPRVAAAQSAADSSGRSLRVMLVDDHALVRSAVRQDADVVLFIFREEVYKPEDETTHNMATMIIGKQRNGPIGQFDLHFHKEFTRFNDLAR